MTFGSAMLASQAQAVPSAYVSKFGDLPIINDTNSTLVRDSEDSQTVWVMPPSAGVTEVTGFSPSSNLGFCSGMRGLVSSSENIQSRVKELGKKVDQTTPELNTARRRVTEARARMAEVAEIEGVESIRKYERTIQALEQKQLDILDQLAVCETSCDELRSAYRESTKELAAERQELRELKREIRVASRAYDRAKSGLNAALEDLKSVEDRQSAMVSRLAAISNEILDLYRSYGALEGGHGSIGYDSGWDGNVRHLEEKYPDFDFKPIMTANTRLNASLVGASDETHYLSSLPMILDYSINGLKYLPWGKNEEVGTSLPSFMGGNLRLSTIGACPIYDKYFFKGTGFDAKKSLSGNPVFAISATYQYPLAFKFRVKANYNLAKIYEEMKKKGEKGGFFSTKSYSSMSSSKADPEHFFIDWQVEDPESIYNATTRERISNEIYNRLKDRVLQTMAEPVPTGIHLQANNGPGVPPEPGAVVFANNGQKRCGLSIQCHAVHWVFKALASSMSQKESEERFKSRWDKSIDETWSAETASYRSGVVAYAKRND